MQLAATTLQNAHVRLEPFEERHRAGLIAAAHADMSIFAHMPFPVARHGYGGWFDWLMAEQAAGRWIAHAVIALAPFPPRFTQTMVENEPPSPLAGEGRVGGASDDLYKLSRHPHPLPPPRKGEGEPHRGSDGAIVGQSCYLNIRARDAGVEIGGTWYRREAQGAVINPAAKLLLIAHAFACGAERVEFKTDALNVQSRAALTKLGASFEGIFRRQMRRPNGTMRDNAYFSIIREEWPALRARIEARLAAFA